MSDYKMKQRMAKMKAKGHFHPVHKTVCFDPDAIGKGEASAGRQLSSVGFSKMSDLCAVSRENAIREAEKSLRADLGMEDEDG